MALLRWSLSSATSTSSVPRAAQYCPLPFRLLSRRAIVVQPQQEQPVRLEHLADLDSGIVEVKLDRPEAKNAIGRQMLEGFGRVVRSIAEDSSARVVIVSSSVPKVFCAGADLKERRLMSANEVRLFVNNLRSAFSAFQDIAVPTIAIVEGAAFGGGLELVLSCDLRICGKDATFSLPETGLAIIPGAGGTQRLPRIVGKSIAMDLIYTGRRVGGTEAASIGLVNYCVPAGEAYAKGLQIARDILQKGPLAVKMAKKAISKGIDMDTHSALKVEEECYKQLLNTEDRIEALEAFAEKRRPIYSGR